MKNKIGRNEFLDAMSGVKEEYVMQTLPEERKGTVGSKRKILRFILPAAAAVTVLVVTLVLIAANRTDRPVVSSGTSSKASVSPVSEPFGDLSSSGSFGNGSRIVLDGMSFELDEEECAYTLIGLEKTGQDAYVIPDSIDGYPVTTIAQIDTLGIDGSLVISKNVVNVPERVWKVFALQGLSIDRDNPLYAFTDECLIDKRNQTLLYGFPGCRIPSDGSVTRIGELAFIWAQDQESFFLPDTITEIGTEAFVGCEKLRQIEIPDSVTLYGRNLFSGCVSLEKVKVSAHAPVIEEGMFSGCVSLTGILLPEGVDTIEKDAFLECRALTDVTFPLSLTTVKEDAFWNGSSGMNARYPGTVAQWCAIDFFGGPSMPYFNGGTLYLGGARVDRLTIPAEVTIVPGARFFGCSFSRVTLEEGVTEIEFSAFARSRGLKEAFLPASLKTIGEGAFNECADMETIRFAGTVAQWNEIRIDPNNDFLYRVVIECSNGTIGPSRQSAVSEGGADYRLNEEESGYILLSFHDRSAVRALIPQTIKDLPVVALAEKAFLNCDMLERIDLPEGVVSVGSEAFRGCEGLRILSLPASLSSIGENAFDEAAQPFEVHYAGTMDAFRASGFENNSSGVLSRMEILCSDGKIVRESDGHRTRVQIGTMIFDLDEAQSGYTLFKSEDASVCTVPSTIDGLPVRYIGTKAFAGMQTLERVTLPETLEGILDGAFDSCENLRQIVFSGGCKKLTFIGKSAFSSCTKLSIPVFPENLQHVDAYAFENCESFGALKVPAGMKTIDRSAWENCTGLRSVDFSGSAVQRIEDSAFAGCGALGRITLPESLATLSDNAFAGCVSLVSVRFENPETLLGSSVFSGCLSLKEVELPEKLEILASGTFRACASLESLSLPGTLQQIADGACKNCTSLRSIVIPDGVNSIGLLAFDGCTALKTAVLPGGYLKVSSQAFRNCTALEEIDLPSFLQIDKDAFRDCTAIRKVRTNSPELWKSSKLASTIEFRNAEILFAD